MKEKDLNLEELICYCFKHSKKELYDAVKENREQELVDQIKSKMVDPGCFCESANPSGKCCLKDLAAFIELVKKST